MTDLNFLELLYPEWGQQFKVESVLFENKTEHQHLIIFKSPRHGTVMALDGVVQTTEADEFYYHEMLTHVPILAHGNAKRVLIIGGGDGGILREVVRHPTVEHVTQVEIDHQVIEMCKEYLPNHSAGAFDDPRVQIEIADGMAFVAECAEQFDVIITDSTDPQGPGEVLFTSDYYGHCKRCLNEGGVMTTQNGVPFMQMDELVNTANRFSRHFADRWFYKVAVPTYVGGDMALGWATDNAELRQLSVDEIRRRYQASGITTRYYNPEIHVGSFALPQFWIDAFA